MPISLIPENRQPQTTIYDGIRSRSAARARVRLFRDDKTTADAADCKCDRKAGSKRTFRQPSRALQIPATFYGASRFSRSAREGPGSRANGKSRPDRFAKFAVRRPRPVEAKPFIVGLTHTTWTEPPESKGSASVDFGRETLRELITHVRFMRCLIKRPWHIEVLCELTNFLCPPTLSSLSRLMYYCCPCCRGFIVFCEP